MALVWLNDDFIDEADAVVSIKDAGLLHGAGVFTTMRAAGGRVFRLASHLSRLRASCQALSVPLAFSDDELTAAVDELLERQDLRAARLRLTVTRGATTQDPLQGLRVAPNVFLTATNFEPYPDEFYRRGMTAILLDDQKLNPYDIQAGHKTLDYFSRFAALREANRRQAGEALWFNVDNFLQCGSVSNVFIVEGDTIVTPPTQADLQLPAVREASPYRKSNVLPGVTRRAVFDYAAAASLEVEMSAIEVDRLLAASEVFITNSIMGVMPVCRIEKRAIGGEMPGRVTTTLFESFMSELEET